MSFSIEQFHRRVIRGDLGLRLALTRAALTALEPAYASATALRNCAFDSGLFKTHAVARPVVCVGNITTGGTGKTPVVCWLATRLKIAGHQPAVLLRGYHGGDEQRMLQAALPSVEVQANANRLAGAAAALANDPDISCFILDDGFQHRRIAREVNLVLIDATNPFGFDHVLPRGLLREPLRGLRRADVFLITHCEAVGNAALETIQQTLRRHRPDAPVFHCEHETQMPLALQDQPVFVFCGIGNPDAFERQLKKNCGFRAFPDHHIYVADDLIKLQAAARQAGAAALVTTAKDWVKISGITQPADALPIESATLELKFRGEDERSLLTFILAPVTARSVALADQ